MNEQLKVEDVVNTDDEGYMNEISQWSRDIAEELARRNFIVDEHLTEEHWSIIKFVHEYYKQNGVGPMVSKIGKATGISAKHICSLFPCGVIRGAYRLAGLPKPPGCV